MSEQNCNTCEREKHILSVRQEQDCAPCNNMLINFFVENPAGIRKQLQILNIAVALDEQVLREELRRLVSTTIGRSVFLGLINQVAEIEYHKSRAEKDGLTGLFSSETFKDFFYKEVSHQKRVNHHADVPSERGIALLFIDLDGFKAVNDRFGHEAGNRILQEVAGILSDGRRESDVVGRLGGDEFAISLDEISIHDAKLVAAYILGRIEQLGTDGESLGVSASIGLVHSRQLQAGDLDGETLLKIADSEMYAAKNTGKNRVCVYNPDNILPFRTNLKDRICC